MNSLAGRTILGFAQLVVGLGLTLFGPAWTFHFWQGWVYVFVFSASSALITAYLWKNDRRLLESRVRAGPRAEKEPSQRVIQLVASFAFIGIFVVASLDRRFSLSHVPLAIVIAGDVLVVLGFLIIFVVFRENPFAGGTIDVAADQGVVSTGPYAIVRHPMYAGALVMLVGTPPALGYWWGFITVALITVVICWRLLDEERFLSKSLPGYAEFCRRVPFRLIPRVW
jgi:protein-S-isoprenylcysteine O-methyltransferase Ste14